VKNTVNATYCTDALTAMLRICVDPNCENISSSDVASLTCVSANQINHQPYRPLQSPILVAEPLRIVVSDVVEKTSTRRRSRILCVVVEKITTRRREGVGVVTEKMKKVDELSTKNRVIYLQQ